MNANALRHEKGLHMSTSATSAPNPFTPDPLSPLSPDTGRSAIPGESTPFSPEDPLQLNYLTQKSRNYLNSDDVGASNQMISHSQSVGKSMHNYGLTNIAKSLYSSIFSPILDETLETPVDSFYNRNFAAPLRRGAPMTSIKGTIFDVEGFMESNGWDLEDGVEPMCDYDISQVKRSDDAHLKYLIDGNGDYMRGKDSETNFGKHLIDLDPNAVTSINTVTAGVRPNFDLGADLENGTDDKEAAQSKKHESQTVPNQSGATEETSAGDDSGLFNVYKRVNETLTTIQGVIRMLADIFEKIQNIANWTNPLVSTIIVILLIVVALLLYLVPMRIILCVIIVHQMSKKMRFLIKKTHVPDEITNIFQRIQTNRELYVNTNSVDGAKMAIGQQNYL